MEKAIIALAAPTCLASLSAHSAAAETMTINPAIASSAHSAHVSPVFVHIRRKAASLS